MNTKALKFGTPIIIYILAYFAFAERGWFVVLPIVYAFLLIPTVELMIKPNTQNMDAAEEEVAKADRLYDVWLYLMVPLQYAALIFFLVAVQDQTLTAWERSGRIVSMGLVCGTFGINVGHELGHRKNRFERNLAKLLLLTSLYMHFYIEHNKGHHKNVSTHEDPSSARRGENVYAFYFRSVTMGYLSAWNIAANEQKQKGKPIFHQSNQMLQFQLLQLLLIALVFGCFGITAGTSFVAAAMIGFLMLETVNYIEHYGLERKKKEKGYERALPIHSWNSNHLLGRLMLFELSRHSDHHYLASRKYQVLRHHAEAPQMPTGYPGMMLLSLVPPAWFRVMHKRMDQQKGLS